MSRPSAAGERSTLLATAGRASLAQQQPQPPLSLHLDDDEHTFDSGGNGGSYSFSAALAAQQHQQRHRVGGRRNGGASGSQTDRSGAGGGGGSGGGMNLLDLVGSSFSNSGSVSARLPRRTNTSGSNGSRSGAHGGRKGGSHSSIDLDARSDFYLEQLWTQRAAHSQLSSYTYASPGGALGGAAKASAAAAAGAGYAMSPVAATPASNGRAGARPRRDHSQSQSRLSHRMNSSDSTEPPSLWPSASMRLLPSLRLLSPGSQSRSPQRAPPPGATFDSPGRGRPGQGAAHTPGMHVLNRPASQARLGASQQSAQPAPVQPALAQPHHAPTAVHRTQLQQPQHSHPAPAPQQSPRARQAIIAPAPSSSSFHSQAPYDAPVSAVWTPVAPVLPFFPAPAPAAAGASDAAPAPPPLVMEEEIAECVAMLQDPRCTLLRNPVPLVRHPHPSPAPGVSTPAPVSWVSREDAAAILSCTAPLSASLGAHVSTPFYVLNLMRSFSTIGYEFWRGNNVPPPAASPASATATAAAPARAAGNKAPKHAPSPADAGTAASVQVLPLRTQIDRLCSALRESTSLRSALLLFLLSPRCALFAHAAVPTMINAESVAQLVETVAVSLRERAGAGGLDSSAHASGLQPQQHEVLRTPVGLEREIWALCQGMNSRAAAEVSREYQHFNQLAQELAEQIGGAQPLSPRPGQGHASPRGGRPAPTGQTTSCASALPSAAGGAASAPAASALAPALGSGSESGSGSGRFVPLAAPPVAGIPFPSWPAKPASPALPSPLPSPRGKEQAGAKSAMSPSASASAAPSATATIAPVAVQVDPTSPRANGAAAGAGGGKTKQPIQPPPPSSSSQPASPRATASSATPAASAASTRASGTGTGDGLRMFGSPTALRRQVLEQQAQIASLEQALAAAASQAPPSSTSAAATADPAATPPLSPAAAASLAAQRSSLRAQQMQLQQLRTELEEEKERLQAERARERTAAQRKAPVPLQQSPASPSSSSQSPAVLSPRQSVPALPAPGAAAPVGASSSPRAQQAPAATGGEQRSPPIVPSSPAHQSPVAAAATAPSTETAPASAVPETGGALPLQRQLLRMHLSYGCSALWSAEFAASGAVRFPPTSSSLTDAQIDRLLAAAAGGSGGTALVATADSARRAIALVDALQPRRNQIASFEVLLSAIATAAR